MLERNLPESPGFGAFPIEQVDFRLQSSEIQFHPVRALVGPELVLTVFLLCARFATEIDGI